ncbi:MAG: hypothetical protein PHW13_01190 [Methylococcales bacterium]|nr:hypothetical protein [Methylococcales bacterium]
MSVLLLATGKAATADVIPNFNPLLSSANSNLGTPVAADFSFDQSGLTGSFTKSGTGWTLTVSGTGNSAFYLPGATTVDTVTNANYMLTANFDSSGNFITTGSMLTITGSLNTELASLYGVSASTGYTNLYSANLTGFGYDASQATIGFSTEFLASAWSSQSPFTGGSAGDAIYLFNQGGVYTGFGVLSGLISQFATGTFAPTSMANVESLASVPLPMPAVLFASGLAGLMGFGRQRRNQAKSI